MVGFGRQSDADLIAGPDLATPDHHAHHSPDSNGLRVLGELVCSVAMDGDDVGSHRASLAHSICRAEGGWWSEGVGSRLGGGGIVR